MGKLWLRINRPQGHWVVKPRFEPTSLWHSRLLGEPRRQADNQPSRSLKPHQELEQRTSWKGRQQLHDHGRKRKERKAGRACTTGLGMDSYHTEVAERETAASWMVVRPLRELDGKNGRWWALVNISELFWALQLLQLSKGSLVTPHLLELLVGNWKWVWLTELGKWV